MSPPETTRAAVRRFGSFLAPLMLATALAGCAGASTLRQSDPSVPARATPAISEQSRSLREPDSPLRTVVPGDTLYSIAWESGRDYRELASWNRIAPPYLIKPGQKLRVVPPAGPDRKVASKPGTAVSTVSSQPKSTAGKATASTRQPAVKPTQPKSSRARTPAASKAPASGRTPATTATTGKSGSRTSGAGAPGWSWPVAGRVQNRYSESDSRGLDIIAARGTPIHAAASGRVVYQGSGLRGYGQLIIIKHNDEFLSAYAHNDRVYVREGDVVRRGQKIADMGSSGTDRTKLHFEIRRQGVPVDPMKYLPRR